MSTIKDITDTKMWTVTTTLQQRWTDQEIDTLLAESKLKCFRMIVN